MRLATCSFRHVLSVPLSRLRWIGLIGLLWLALVPGSAQAQQAKLLVESNVGNAVIRMDGDQIGQTSAEGTALLDSLSAGTYTVQLNKPGYWTASSRVTLEPGLTTTVNLPLKSRPGGEAGKLFVSTNVPNATVLLDGKKLGRTDAEGKLTTKKLELGSHRIVVRKDGYEQSSQTVAFENPGLDQTATLQLDSLGAPPSTLAQENKESDTTTTAPNVELAIDAGVANAKVRIDDSTWGRAANDGIFATEIEQGRHYIETKKKGFEPAETVVELTESQRALTLRPTPHADHEEAGLVGHLTNNIVLLFGALIGIAGLMIAFLPIPGLKQTPLMRRSRTDRFDRYDVMDVLQRSEFSTVYRANDPKEHGEVTLTVLDDPYADDPNHIEPFLEKGRILQEIHAADPDAPLLNVYRVGREHDADDGRPFILMEYLEGETLLSHLKNKDLFDTEDALATIRQICSGLQLAHDHDVCHANLSPANIIVTQLSPTVRIKMVGFGLEGYHDTAKALTEDVGGGTTAYVAPEQLQTGRGDWRSDMYAAGILFYKLVTGRPPQVDENAGSPEENADAYPDLPDRIPDHVKPVFYRMISPDPDRRPTAARVSSVLDLLPMT